MKNINLTKLALAVFFLLPFGEAGRGFTQSLIRGPYLQSPGQNSIILRWRTDVATDSRVNFGLTIAANTTTTDDATSTTEHRVKLTGLSPKTTYYYTIGSTSSVLLGPDSLLHFTTAPDTTIPNSFRLWAIGDFGHGNQAEADVRDSYLRLAEKEKPADLWLWLGDNAYSDGTDAEFQTKVFDSTFGYGNIFWNLPFASTSGNHDYNSICPWQPTFCNENPENHSGPYLDIIDPPIHGELGGVPSNRKLFYSFDYGDAHFVSLNSELGSLVSSYNWLGLFNSDTSFTSPMLDWLKADLAATTKKWKIVLWHQTPYSGQDNFTDDGVQQFCVASRVHFNPIIEKFGVDLVLVSHDHNYQRTFLINGHYGNSSSFTPSMKINGTSGKEDLGEPYIKYKNGPMKDKGAVYVISGNASEGNDYSPISHPAIYWGEACGTCFGSFIVDINNDTLRGRYLASDDTIADYFTILKKTYVSPEGIEEQKVLGNFTVYPNPSPGKYLVDFSLKKKSTVRIDVLDAIGKVVYSQNKTTLNPGNHQLTVDLEKSNFAAGNYFIRLDCEGVSFKKVVKKE